LLLEIIIALLVYRQDISNVSFIGIVFPKVVENKSE